ncbi:MAG: restriction endonuclease subunit S [Gammaproteobacteria bacterium]|nr:restriction endonuclease subunit S [Gammaproteobacteria bacterium]
MRLDTFFDTFDQLADAPNALPRLRRFIADLAVKGRLVAQDSGDEPGDALLNRIRAEKQRLFQTGEIKKPDELPPVGRDSLSFELPPGWTVSLLGEVAVCLDYKRKPINGTERDLRISGKDESELFPYYGATQQQGWIDDFIFDQELVLLGEDGVPFFDDLRPKAYVISGKSWVNNHAHVFQGILASNRFLMLWLNTFDFTGRVAGSTRSKLNQAKAVDIPVPLPPLAEQKRIVAKVEELMALCDRLEAQQQERETRHAALARASLARFAEAPTPANLSFLFHPSYAISPADLRKSILALAFQGRLVPQDPNDEPAKELLDRIGATKEERIRRRVAKRVAVEPNPNDDTSGLLPPGWVWTRLGNSFDVRDGTHATPKYTTEGFPLVTSKNIYSGSLSFNGVNLISEKDHREISERSRVDRGDILFAMIGSIGNPVIVDTDREFSIKNVALFKYYSETDSEPRFLLFYLKLVAEEMRAKAAGGVQSFVSLGFLRNYIFPLPPLAEQRRIVAKVDQLMTLVDKLEAQLTASGATATKLLAAIVAELTAA